MSRHYKPASSNECLALIIDLIPRLDEDQTKKVITFIRLIMADKGKLTEADMTPGKLCPNCGIVCPIIAHECVECPWEFGT